VTNLDVVALGNHLWQSTLFALVVGCLTLLLRKNGARARCLLWLAASAKFLIPFALLTAVGSRIPWPSSLSHGTAPALLSMVSQTALRITHIDGQGVTTPAPGAHAANHSDIVVIALEVLWALGMFAVTARWLARWLIVRRALHESRPTGLAFVVPVRSSTSQLEPAVVGILHPVLLLPEGMERHLAADEMEAVLAHERCHVAWRDNLTATLHMVVEALFWFHPLIWWLGMRIVDERERACDEQVLAQGHTSRSYAEGILKVCEHYLQAPLISVAGIGGANLSRRIEAIMKNRLIERLDAVRKVVLTLAASATIAIPLAVGAFTSSGGNADAATAEANVAPLRNVSIQLAPPQPALQAPGGYNVFGLMLQDGRRVQTVSSLRSAIATAYGVDESQVLGKDLSKEPLYQVTVDNPWPESATDSGEVRTARYRKSLNEIRALRRDLLVTHFGLVVKQERRQMQGYVLTIGPGGSKLNPDSDAPYWKEGAGMSRGEIFATKAPTSLIVRLLNGMFRAPVLDQTGLDGNYDYKLTWPESLPGTTPTPDTMAKALEEQLGLHLEAKPVTVAVVDVVSLKSPEQIITTQ
jgi:bla regulator protein BlaR1